MDAPAQPPIAHDAKRVLRARMAVSYVFFLLGALTGVWAVHIPTVQAKLGIDPAVLGLALLMLAIGAVVTMPLTGLALSRFGSYWTTAVLTLVFAVVAPLPVLAPTTPLLFASLLLFGAAMGGLDVAMNTQATEVEAARARPTMSSFHGFYSVGALAGAGLGSVIVALGWGSGSGATIAAAAFFGASIWAILNLLPGARPVAQGPRFVLPNRAVLGLGVIALLTFAGEGAVTDWSALYLATIKHATTATAGLGFALFSVGMTVCRLFGDTIVARLGGPLTVLGGGSLMTIGMVIAIASPEPYLSALGFAIVGIGAANVVPVALSAAGRGRGMSAGAAVAAVTTMGYSGFLIFPPLIGFVAQSFGLSVALAIVAVMGAAVAALTGQVRR